MHKTERINSKLKLFYGKYKYDDYTRTIHSQCELPRTQANTKE